MMLMAILLFQSLISGPGESVHAKTIRLVLFFVIYMCSTVIVMLQKSKQNKYKEKLGILSLIKDHGNKK